MLRDSVTGAPWCPSELAGGDKPLEQVPERDSLVVSEDSENTLDGWSESHADYPRGLLRLRLAQGPRVKSLWPPRLR